MRQMNFTDVFPERVQKLADTIRNVTPGICLEHPRAEIRAYEEFKDEPRIIQRAHLLRILLTEEKKIFINDGELIVGNVTDKQRGSNISGELFSKFLARELDDPEKDPAVRQYDRHYILDEEREELRNTILPYFKGKTLADRIYETVDPDTKEHGFMSLSSCPHIPSYADVLMWQDAGHVAPNHEKILHIGLNGIREEIVYQMNRLEQPWMKYDKKERREFYQAALIVIDAAIAFAHRYADLAEEMAQTEENENRKAELLKIAEVCRRVPAEPARNWWEALQSTWFINVILNCEQFNFGIGMMGRFDVYMLPFYEASKKEGMTDQEALELLELFYVKTASFTQMIDYGSAGCQSGFPMGQTINIGGELPGGKDASNEITWLVLEADEHVGLFQPDIGYRVWEGSPEEFLKKCWHGVSLGRGKPKFYGEQVCKESCRKKYPWLTDDELLDWIWIGCFELQLSGVDQNHGYAGVLNAPKVLEMAMYNGQCALCGKQMGPMTGDPRTFATMDQFKEAVRKQMNYWAENLCKAVKYEIEAIKELQPAPFTSICHEGPTQTGKDLLRGGGSALTEYGVITGGLADAGDSLAVIDQLIYKEKKVSWDEMLDALKNNFEGYEELRQMCLNDVPKFGNDDDFADQYTAWMGDLYADAIDAMNLRKEMIPSVGGIFTSGTVNGNSHVGMGPNVGALPSGRLSGTPLNDTMSPVSGADIHGATAVIKSLSKMHLGRMTVGTGMNQRFAPSMFQTEEDYDRLVAYIRAFNELGLAHVQLNVVSSEVLKDAVAHPEKHRDLIVRVATFCSNFTELSPLTQQQIIERTEHAEM